MSKVSVSGQQQEQVFIEVSMKKLSSIGGLDVEGVKALKAQGYNPFDYYNADHLLKALSSRSSR